MYLPSLVTGILVDRLARIMKSCPPGTSPPLTDLEPADKSSVRQRRQARQFFAESRQLKAFSSTTGFLETVPHLPLPE